MFITEPANKGAVVLEAREWLYLAERLGMSRWLGTKHPFHVFLREGLDPIAGDARESLLRKGYITPSAHGDHVSLPLDVMNNLTAASHAGKACRLNYVSGKRAYEEYLHIAGEQLIRLERLFRRTPSYLMERTAGARQVSGALAGKMKWNTRTTGELPALMMSRKQFEALMHQAPEMDLDRITSRLAEMTDDEEGGIALAKCIKTRISQGDIRFYAKRGEDWETQNMQFINNDHMNWLIRFSAKEEEDWMIATPTPRQKFQEMLLMWFRQPLEL
ncbi:hypothetical protein [Paenibacillus macerans]|uniref:hypothetical protein n=1 Tax=Paenibacillus macerans TaxID=44252 RepID=UPI003D3151ED